MSEPLGDDPLPPGIPPSTTRPAEYAVDWRRERTHMMSVVLVDFKRLKRGIGGSPSHTRKQRGLAESSSLYTQVVLSSEVREGMPRALHGRALPYGLRVGARQVRTSRHYSDWKNHCRKSVNNPSERCYDG